MFKRIRCPKPLSALLVLGAVIVNPSVTNQVAHAKEIASWSFTEPAKGHAIAVDTVHGLTASVFNNTKQAAIATYSGDRSLQLMNNGLTDTEGVCLTVQDDPRLTDHDSGGEGYDTLSIVAEVKLSSLDGQAQIVRKIGDDNIGYELFIRKDGRVAFRVKGTNGTSVGTSKTRIEADGKWHTIEGTYASYEHREPYNVQVVLDGVVGRRTRDAGRLTDTDSPLTIGGFIRDDGSVGQRLDGYVRNVKVMTDRTDLLDKSGVGIDDVEPTGEHLMGQPGLISAGFIVDPLPTPECHAPTIAEASDGSLIAAWFGGTCEGHPDVGIWQSRLNESGWSNVREVVDTQTTDGSVGSAFNPVLYQFPSGPSLLFYMTGPLMTAEGNLKTSNDGGRTWSTGQRLPDSKRGATKNKPVLLSDGTLICPDNSNKLVFHRTRDYGSTWLETGVAPDPKDLGAIQPTILTHPDGSLQALGRSSCGNIVMTWSNDGGKTWSPLEKTNLPNNNSGIDAVTLDDGRHVLVCNPVPLPEGKWGGPRTPLSVLISDDGLNWKHAVTLEDEPGEYSYPSVIQTADGLVHVVYTWHRLRVKHAVLNPDMFELKEME